MILDKYVKDGKVTKQGEAFQNGLCWGMFMSACIYLLATFII